MSELLTRLASATGLGDLYLESQLSAAPTGSRWLVRAPIGRLVVTVDTPLTTALGIDRHYQFRLLELIEPLAIAPQPVLHDAEAGMLVVSYLEGAVPRRATLQRRELAGFANLFRSLHATESGKLARNEAVSFVSRLGRYAEIARTQQGDELYAGIRRGLSQVSGSPVALCHNDAHSGNLVCGKMPALIDWDYAGAGPVWFDLVSFVAGCRLNSADTDYFLDAYFGRRGAWTRDDQAGWLLIRDQVEVLWELCVASQINHGSRR